MPAYKLILVLPTLNAASAAEEFIQTLQSQTLRPHSLLVLDSNSTDSTREIFKHCGADVLLIEPATFDHGSTRQLVVNKYAHDSDILVFMTQDAMLASDASLENLINAFCDESVGAAYGRQLPNKEANPIETHARLFNYPAESHIKGFEDRKQLGIKTCFMSNSFAAYRCSALQQVGGFPENNIVSEETYVAAKMLESGWQIKYCADATVYHSHNYTIRQEFQRYFDLGVFHSREPWIRSHFGQAEGEGTRYVLSQLSFLMKEHMPLIPPALLRTVFKLFGFRLGFCNAYLPCKLKTWLSMQKHYWAK